MWRWREHVHLTQTTQYETQTAADEATRRLFSTEDRIALEELRSEWHACAPNAGACFTALTVMAVILFLGRDRYFVCHSSQHIGGGRRRFKRNA